MHRILFLLLAVLLSACASHTPPRLAYDFGPAPSAATGALAKAPLLALAEITAAPALDGSAMQYRLLYDNDLQLRPYAWHVWSMAPAQLLTLRIKQGLSAAGMQVVGAGTGVAAPRLLRIELDEFAQAFTGATTSEARIALRATLSEGRTVLAQRSFAQQVAAPSADAPGGARAMQQASDRLIAELHSWLRAF